MDNISTQTTIDPIYGTIVPVKPVVEVEKKFDLTVNHRDPKSGRLVGHNPYRLHCVGNKNYYERPPGSGNLYWPDGDPAGRIVKHKESGKLNIIEGADHITWISPQEKAAQAQVILAEKVAKIEDMEAKMMDLEARAIKAEAKLNDTGATQASSAKETPAPKKATTKVNTLEGLLNKKG